MDRKKYCSLIVNDWSMVEAYNERRFLKFLYGVDRKIKKRDHGVLQWVENNIMGAIDDMRNFHEEEVDKKIKRLYYTLKEFYCGCVLETLKKELEEPIPTHRLKIVLRHKNNDIPNINSWDIIYYDGYYMNELEYYLYKIGDEMWRTYCCFECYTSLEDVSLGKVVIGKVRDNLAFITQNV